MALSDPRRMAFRLWVVLVLLVIGIQSASPVPAPLERVEGSAFSAATADVTVTTQRRELEDATEARLVPLQTGADAVIAAAHARPFRPAFAPGPRLRPETRGPPPRESVERLPDKRGPPAA
jgi:hypothetical protein